MGVARDAPPIEETDVMAFGQSSGPAAGPRLVNELLELLNAAGHSDFRDARGPLGFTQRQAAGKFTIAEAQSLIDELLEAQHRGEIADAPPASNVLSPAEEAIRSIPDALLAAELQRRGWIVVEP